MHNKNLIRKLLRDFDEKNQKIEEYWQHIQNSRLKNRIRKVFFLKPIVDERNDLLKQVLITDESLTRNDLDKVENLKYLIRLAEDLLPRYWEEMQQMRLSNRLKRLNLYSVIRKVKDLRLLKATFTTFKNEITYIFQFFAQLGEEKKIKEFIYNNSESNIITDLPFVSIIILNRNGLSHLKQLFQSFKENTLYPNYEIIVVDNASNDRSINFLNSIKGITLRIIENKQNETFSKANNEAVQLANGELLVFLNNDVIPLHGWLNQLVKTYFKFSDVGLVGSKLVYPRRYRRSHSLKIQHNGIGFRIEEGFIRPINLDNLKGFFDVEHGIDINYPAVTAACVLLSKKKFLKVGMFDENYNYGYEDVDLGLKLFKAGFKNYVAGKSILFHNEFGTQERQESQAVRARRVKNKNYFREKWYRLLFDQIWIDKLNGQNTFYTENLKLKVGFVVTEEGENATAGDYFTALEFAEELYSLGYEIKFYSKKSQNWYDLDPDLDVLIVLLHRYNLDLIKCSNKELIKIAWIRNWFEEFYESLWFKDFNLVLSSSKEACEKIENKIGKKAYYFPLASSEKRFGARLKKDENYFCDYCFTGSYWNDHREIIDHLNPDNLKEHSFHLYGKNWESVQKFEKYAKGFVNYKDIPKVYANTKLLIDDANRVTKPWGSVNSRVFDALMSGVLVLTNNSKGSNDLFDGKLPVYNNSDELEDLIKYYLKHENERKALIKELHLIVLSSHTYKIRALRIKEMLTTYYDKSIAIKVPIPLKAEARSWGDYHFAQALKKEFEKLEFRTEIQFLEEWYDQSSYSVRNVLVLRGLSKYETNGFQTNIMWNISHPSKVTLDEYREYDCAFVASIKWVEELKNRGLNNVVALLQCTDPEVFKIADENERVKSELLFVGNSRGIHRKIIQDLKNTKYDLSIYGNGWQEIDINQGLIKDNYIENSDLYKYYGGASILLNDHWDDMSEFGFISNRLFDGMACNATIISDYVEGIDDVFEGKVITYLNKEDLIFKIDSILNSTGESSTNGRELVVNKHTFNKRANQIIEQIQHIEKCKL